MPNSVENQPPKPTGNIKSINVIDELAAGDPPGTSDSNLFSCYGTPSFNLSSTATGHGPWMFPVVRAREVFYNVCSDYGLLNKATIIARTPCTSSDPTPIQGGTSSIDCPAQDGISSVDCPAHNSSYVDIQVDPPDVTHRGNAEMGALPVSHGKQLLAWEIDTSDFNVVTSKLKSRTGSLKKQNTKKIRPLEKHNKKNNDSSPYTVLEEMKHRKVLDLRRWYCISRPQYKTSCGISSLVSCWNYLFSTCGTGSLPPITQEEALHILGFHQPFEDIRFGPFTGNATLMRWFRQLNEHFHMRGCSYVLYKPHGKNRTAGETAEGALMKLTQGLRNDSMAYIYHCQNHYFCPIGFEATPLKASKAFRGKLPLDEMEFWILIGEPSKKHPAIHCKKWADIVTDLNTQNPEYLDIRNPEKGIQYRKTKKVGGNLHCIIAFQKPNWQKLSTWMMNIGNFRCETCSKVSDCKASNSAIGLERVLNDDHEPSMNDKNSSDGFQQASEWKQNSSLYEYRDGGSPESETDEESIEVFPFLILMMALTAAAVYFHSRSSKLRTLEETTNILRDSSTSFMPGMINELNLLIDNCKVLHIGTHSSDKFSFRVSRSSVISAGVVLQQPPIIDSQEAESSSHHLKQGQETCQKLPNSKTLAEMIFRDKMQKTLENCNFSTCYNQDGFSRVSESVRILSSGVWTCKCGSNWEGVSTYGSGGFQGLQALVKETSYTTSISVGLATVKYNARLADHSMWDFIKYFLEIKVENIIHHSSSKNSIGFMRHSIHFLKLSNTIELIEAKQYNSSSKKELVESGYLKGQQIYPVSSLVILINKCPDFPNGYTTGLGPMSSQGGSPVRLGQVSAKLAEDGHQHIEVEKKNKDKSSSANYCPISQLSIISKVTEGVVESAFKWHLLSNNLLSDAQFGFHQGHSAPDLITALVQIWAKGLNSRVKGKEEEDILDCVLANFLDQYGLSPTRKKALLHLVLGNEVGLVMEKIKEQSKRTSKLEEGFNGMKRATARLKLNQILTGKTVMEQWVIFKEEMFQENLSDWFICNYIRGTVSKGSLSCYYYPNFNCLSSALGYPVQSPQLYVTTENKIQQPGFFNEQQNYQSIIKQGLSMIVSSIMGVKGLWKLLECTGQPINPETLEGKILAVDISIWLNQAVKGARDCHGNAVPNAHLLILLHRLCKLLFYRIRPIVVFDGKTPLLKKQTLINRWQRKELAIKDTKKTTDKLLRTILKQHALKNAFGGRSDEVIPSLSQVRRGETDDIFILPSLVNEEENSSEEEAEKEWEERMKNEKLFQNTFLENPHSVDIESEDFASLPPEVRHEILTDLKEFTKRRRSLLQTMPQESTDFSQYQLSGLLKRNRLNQHIEGIQKEMNKQYCGQIQMECNNEGGFIKDVETRRLVSEDASHYILIKGIQSKNSEDRETNLQNTTPEKIAKSTAAELVSDAGLEPFKDSGSQSPLSARASRAQNDVAAAAPPSPRTMIAIQAAMLESSSDEEMEFGKDKLFPVEHGSTLHSANIPAKYLNLSPRTQQAIQQDLKDNEMMDDKKDSENQYDSARKQMVQSCSSNNEHEDQKVYDCENQLLKISFNPQTTQNKLIISRTVLSCEMQEKFPLADQHSLILSVNAGEQNINSGTVDIAEVINSEQLHLQTSETLNEHENHTKIHSEDNGEIINNRKYVHPLKTTKLAENSNEAIPNMDHPSSSGVAMSIQPDRVKPPPYTKIKGEFDLKSFISSKEKQDLVEKNFDHQKICTKNEDGSDSEGSFIEVIDTNKVDLHNELFLPDIFTPLTPAAESTPMASCNVEVTSETIQSQAFICDHMEEVGKVVQQRMKVEVDQHKQPSVEEATTDNWSDLDLCEIEDLENNLFIEQSGLQSRKQQQERIAATVTGQMYLDSQELLRLFGIPYIVAPTEAEAQCAYLDLTDQTSGTITDDSDIWLFGARHVYKNFFNQDKYVEYYQYIHIHNQLGLDRTKMINLAYFLGSDYTEGIPGVGYVTAMELLNEFIGPGLEPLIHIRDWWTEAQKNKKLRDNPNDTKVKKKLRHLDIYPGFPNPAVAEEYLKPAVDESKVSLSWGRPDLDEIREFCENRFGWTRKKTDEVLLPVMKQLNTHQSQLHIDSFFRMEQHAKQAIKSQRLRRAVTCMLRKEQEALGAVQETTGITEGATNSAVEEKDEGVASGTKGRSNNSQIQHRKRKQTQKSPEQPSGGGFIESINLSKMSDDCAEDDSEIKSKKYSKMINLNRKTPEKQMKDGREKAEIKTANMSSSSSDESGDSTLVTARSVFEKRGMVKGLKIKPRKKLRKFQ
ncbi:uncharacterized protein ercc5 [Heterodontus francisci]|uniref:uncharacterized protein ercc5 n=1 Tax=Heterodontus francisci TaxID=7792 RepID=UPI00355BBD49